MMLIRILHLSDIHFDVGNRNQDCVLRAFLKDAGAFLKGDNSPACHVPAFAKSAGTYFYLKDESGNVTDVVDDSGNEVQHYVYSVFGERLRVLDKPNGQDIAPVLKTSYGFSGRELDEESGLYYFRNRYYDPRIGRFLQEDPEKGSVANTGNGLLNDGASAGLPAALEGNGYYYAWNNPVRFNDPFGLDVFFVGVSFGWGAGGSPFSLSGAMPTFNMSAPGAAGNVYTFGLAFDTDSSGLYGFSQIYNIKSGSGFLFGGGYQGGVFNGDISQFAGAGTQQWTGGGWNAGATTAVFESSGHRGVALDYFGPIPYLPRGVTYGAGTFNGTTNTTTKRWFPLR